MDKPHHHIVLIGILCLITVANCEGHTKSETLRQYLDRCQNEYLKEMTQSTVEQNRTAVCLMENATKEIHLHCGDEAAIHVKSVLQGYQDIPQDTTFCTFKDDDECGVTDPELYDTMVEKCMGAADCLVPVKRISLNPCGEISNYVQFEFECIPKSTPTKNIIDVCGDVLGGESILRESGYIQTPNYPALYPPDESCMCSLKPPPQTETHITLTVLDIDIQSVDKTRCVGDWLEYTTPGVMWGKGVRMCNATQLNKTHLIEGNLELHFRADSMNESRGFWIKYEGLDEASRPVPVRIQCSQYHPSVNMEEGQCLSDRKKSELFLSCNNPGVIEITGIEHWTKNDDKTCPLVTKTSAENCYETMDDQPVIRSCMGQKQCNVPISSQPIPKCQAESNFFEVQYKCISDTDEVHNIVDICGDSMNGVAIHRKSGFIETPNYPHNYPPNVNCQCHLTTTEPNSTIQLRVIDLVITGDVNKMCKEDWLEYDTEPSDWNKGIKICDGLKEEQVLETSKSDIYLNFNSDGWNENRGFWIQYSARRLPEDTEVPVKVTCYEWHGNENKGITDGSNPSVKKSSKPGDSSNKNIPLIVGLTVVIVLMLILCIGMVLYKVKLAKKKYPPMQSTALDTPLDKSFNSLKRYSTLNEEGGPVDHGHRNKGGRFKTRHDEYQRTALAASQLNLPSSYVNPVFEGSPVV